jgi:ComF family protein
MLRVAKIIDCWGEGAARLLFPPACAFCQRELEEAQQAGTLCERCAVMIAPVGVAHCPRCGLRFPPGVPQGVDCEQCRGTRPAFERVWTLGSYDDLLRTAVLRGKRPQGQLLIGALTRLLLGRQVESLHTWNADLVVPTPLYWLRRAWRGSNSPETIAELLALELGIPCAPFGLQRRRMTRPQAGLPHRERRANVRDAFRASKRCDFRDARVLLVDDILTTGATLTELAKVVRAAGATAVGVVVLARAEGPV